MFIVPPVKPNYLRLDSQFKIYLLSIMLSGISSIINVVFNFTPIGDEKSDATLQD
jgi:hypothetical protein